MKTQLLLPLLALPLCGLGEALPFERDYTIVDLGNGLITKLMDVGTTSITFSVEWTPNVEIDHRWLYLMGKLDIEERGWHFLTSLEVDHTQDQGNVAFEVLYEEISWTYPGWAHEYKDFEKKAFFAVRIPAPSDIPLGVSRGKYEEDDETDVFDVQEKTDEETPSAEVKQGEAQGRVAANSPNHEGKVELGIGDKELGEEELGIEKEGANRLWLYLAILSFILALFYFMRKKKT